MGDAIAEEYKSSLADLNCNSKLHINVLTILADENKKFAANIVDTIVDHVDSIPPDMKLPCLYLIDSIIKNVGQDYVTILNQKIVSIFASVFQKVDERTRAQMYKLRLTWTAVFPNKTLYALDVKVKEVDPAWPVNAQPPPQSIHINPKFLGAQVSTAISLNPVQTFPAIIQQEENALKVKQQIVLKQLWERQEQLRLLEERKRLSDSKTEEQPNVIPPHVAPSSTVGLTTAPITPIAHIVPVPASGSNQTSAAPKLAGESSQVTTSDTQKLGQNQTASHTAQKVVIRPVQLIPHVPPKAAVAPNQRDPRQRDPRRAANSNQVASQQTAPISSISQASTVVVPKATTVAPIVASVVKVQPVALPETKSSPKESPSKGKEEISESSKNSEKKSENTLDTKSESTNNNKKSPVKLKSNVQVPASSQNESRSSTHKDKTVTGNKRKKSKEQKTPDDKPVPITSDTKTTTSVKHTNEKNSEKNKISPKDKKSSPYTSRNQTEEKRYTRRRSRSPVHKTEKKSPKTRGGNRDLRQRKQSADRAKKKLSTKLRNESNDADVDLRRLRSSVDDKHQKGAKHTSEDEKKEDASYEPPEKKTKEDKENATVKDSLFGNEDQDYRQLPKSGKKCDFEGWATYKKAHPDEFKSPLRQSRESVDSNQSPYEEYGNHSGKKPPRESCSPNEMEFDRLGRPRLLKMRQSFSRSDSFQGCLRRDGDFPYNHQSNSDHLRDFLRDPEDLLRQAEERYQLGSMSKDKFEELQHLLENVHSRNDFRMKEHGPNRPLHYGHDEEARYHRPQAFVNNLEPMYNNNRVPTIEGMSVQGPNRRLPAECHINLDGKLRTIHWVDDKALVLMDENDPRQLTFGGNPTEVRIEGLKPILLRFDGKPVEFELSGTVHSMKFGTPSRELYIDNCPYEGKFGGSPFLVKLENGHVYNVSLGGPQPILQVSEQPARELYQKYLDQNNRNDIDMRLQPNIAKNDTDWRPLGQKSNAQDYQRQGGGPPFIKQEPDDFSFEEEKFSNERDNIYFSSQQKPQDWKKDYPLLPLPEVADPMGSRQQDWRHPPFQGVKMANSPHNTPPHDGGSYPSEWDQSRPSRQFNAEQRLDQSNRPWMPRDLGPGGPRFNRPPRLEDRAFNTLRDNVMQERFEEQQRYPESFPGSQGNFRHHLVRPEFKEERGSMPLLPPPQLMAPWRHPRNSVPSENTRRPVLLPPPQPPIHMRVQGLIKQEVPDDAELPITLPSVSEISLNPPLAQIVPSSQPSSVPDNLAPAEASSSLTVPALSLPIDITSLFAKLVATGIISQPSSDKPQVSVKTEKETEDENKELEKKEENELIEHIPPIELKLKSLRKKQQGVINCLYRGSQCASCGMRFKEIHGEKYSRHLDWHFRMNRREKDGIKKAFSRKWYYEVEDWIQFEEFEDLEERARSFFELQADQQFQVEPAVEVPSVPASGQETEACVVCGEPFQLFWVEEEEEWHLRNAVRHDEQAYHPSCYEDYVKSLQEPETPIDNAPSIVIKEEDIKKEPLDEEDIKAEPISDVDIRKELEDEKIKKEKEEEMIKKEISELVNMMAETIILEEEERRLKEEELRLKEEMRIKEEMMQGKPGEEEVIGLISESDMETEDVQQVESERVVLGSGGIIMKVRAESLKPSSPSVDNTTEKETAQKEPEESDEEEFRPPTPDPRFQVLPPVQRGTELSGLCCIM